MIRSMVGVAGARLASTRERERAVREPRGRVPGGVTAGSILRMQQLVGNRAVRARLPGASPSESPRVQAPSAGVAVRGRGATIHRQGGVLSDEAVERRETA